MHDEPAPDALIDALLRRIADDPANVDVHQQLRGAALERKVGGGPAAGLVDRMRPPPQDAPGRLIHAARLWSLDPGNLDRLVAVAQAIERYSADRPDVDFEPVRQWLNRIVRAARAEA